MPKAAKVRRETSILRGFDIAKLRDHVVEADRSRPPTQTELAHSYFAQPDIAAMAREFPASVDKIIGGICEQDPRFVNSGRLLLERLLRKEAFASGPVSSPRRKRHSSTGAPASPAPGEAGIVAAGSGTPSMKGTVGAATASGSSGDGRDTPAMPSDFVVKDEGGAELYGG